MSHGTTSDPNLRLRPARPSDAPALAKLVDEAYDHYVERMGTPPRPMTDDYDDVIRSQRVTVAEVDGAIVGLVALTVTDEGFLIDNIAVDPRRQGSGVGRTLLVFAEDEARRGGFDSIHLYTNEVMVENIALYTRIGYVEFDRRARGAYSVVYLRKRLG